METTNHKGAIAEAAIALEAIKLGVAVLKPIAEHGRYDLGFDLGERIIRVQVKWGALNGEVIQVHIARSKLATRGYLHRPYQAGEIDALGVYCGDLDCCYVVPVDLCTDRSSIWLRVGPPANGQRASLNWAAQYRMTRGAIAQLGERLTGSQKVGGSSPPGSTSPEPTCTTVGAHEFRNHFGYYMERAAAGEEIAVSRRGKGYVRLGPHQPKLALTE